MLLRLGSAGLGFLWRGTGVGVVFLQVPMQQAQIPEPTDSDLSSRPTTAATTPPQRGALALDGKGSVLAAGDCIGGHVNRKTRRELVILHQAVLKFVGSARRFRLVARVLGRPEAGLLRQLEPTAGCQSAWLVHVTCRSARRSTAASGAFNLDYHSWRVGSGNHMIH